MRRPLTFLITGLFAFALSTTTSLVAPAPASAATIAPTTECSNGIPDTAGLGLICEVTVVNTITGTGGSATVTIRECHGAANDASTCTTTTDVLTEPVTAVDQCNDALNGGGATIECSVDVTNNFVGVDPGETDATVNQCVGSGDGIANDCDPFPATTTGATITQCNGSANGGTLVELRCTATGTESSAFSVTINQCNGSANGGGSSVICSANIENNAEAGATPTPTASPTTGPTAGATPRPTPPAGAAPTAPSTSTADGFTALPGGGTGPLLPAGLSFLVALSLILAVRRYGRRDVR